MTGGDDGMTGGDGGLCQVNRRNKPGVNCSCPPGTYRIELTENYLTFHGWGYMLDRLLGGHACMECMQCHDDPNDSYCYVDCSVETKGPGAWLDGGNCECKCSNGYFSQITNKCIQPCASPLRYKKSSHSCECPDGKTKITVFDGYPGSTVVSGYRCVDSECSGGKIKKNPNENCVCPDGQHENSSGNCVCSNACSSSDQFQNSYTCACSCPTGQSLVNNQCVCPAGTNWNPTQNKCKRIPVCANEKTDCTKGIKAYITGEIRPSKCGDSITYNHGTWGGLDASWAGGGATPGADGCPLSGYIEHVNQCYLPGQKQDSDWSDVVVGYICIQ